MDGGDKDIWEADTCYDLLRKFSLKRDITGFGNSVFLACIESPSVAKPVRYVVLKCIDKSKRVIHKSANGYGVKNFDDKDVRT